MSFLCGSIHGADEWINMESLDQVTAIYTQTILSYIGQMEDRELQHSLLQFFILIVCRIFKIIEALDTHILSFHTLITLTCFYSDTFQPMSRILSHYEVGKRCIWKTVCAEKKSRLVTR